MGLQIYSHHARLTDGEYITSSRSEVLFFALNPINSLDQYTMVCIVGFTKRSNTYITNINTYRTSYPNIGKQMQVSLIKLEDRMQTKVK